MNVLKQQRICICIHSSSLRAVLHGTWQQIMYFTLYCFHKLFKYISLYLINVNTAQLLQSHRQTVLEADITEEKNDLLKLHKTLLSVGDHNKTSIISDSGILQIASIKIALWLRKEKHYDLFYPVCYGLNYLIV